MFSRLLERLLPSRALRWAGAVFWMAVIAWVSLHVVLNRASVAAEIRDRVRERLGQRLVSFELGSDFDFAWNGEVWLGPLTIEPAPDGPTLQVHEIGVRPAWGLLLRGRLEMGTVTLQGVELRLDRRGERVAELVRDFKSPVGHRGDHGASSEAPVPTLELEDVKVVVEASRDDDEDRTLGPFDARVRVERGKDGTDADGRVWLQPSGELSGVAHHSPERGWTASLTAKRVPARTWLGAFAGPSVDVREGLASGQIALRLSPGLAEATADVNVMVEKLVVAGERIAGRPVGPARLGYAGTVHYDREESRLSLEKSRWLLGPESLEVPFDAQIELGANPKLDAALRVGPVDLQDLISALPPQLAPGEDAPHLEGSVSAEVRASGPLQRPTEWATTLKLDTAGLKEKAKAAPLSIRGPFSYRPAIAEGSGRTMWIGGKSPSYVPLGELPQVLGQAVTTAEDAGFYAHHGFDLEGLQNGLAAAIGGERLRGGSTLTQQLVKNVYLTPDRTLARKISEALITLQVEAALPKQRILEVYLNIIEWGPGVYGVGEASRYYFGVDARSLDAKQAVFLASIIPNPTHWGPYFRHSGLSDAWNKRLSDLLFTLHERGAIGDEPYRRALEEQLVFRPESEESAALTRGR